MAAEPHGDILPPTKPLTLNVIRNQKPYLIMSWNVDGYSADIHTWLLNLVTTVQPDVIFLSETKRSADTLAGQFAQFTNYNAVINAHVPAQMHGVVMLIRKEHTYEQIQIAMNIVARKDTKVTEAATGRVITIRLNQQLYIIGSYTPNSGRSDPVKLNYRTQHWDPAFFQLLELLRSQGPTVWVGDINVALDDIDVSNPKSMKGYAGFTAEERANFRAVLSTGNWIDIWRQQHPTDRVYTWCGAPPRPNYGLRLDNIVVSKSLVDNMMNTFMITECPMSADHIPVCAYIRM